MPSSVSTNVLEHGCGGLNVTACRIEAGTDYSDRGPEIRHSHSAMAYMGSHQTRPWVQKAIEEGKPVKITIMNPGGRWPGNLILEHRPDCRQEGTRRVLSNSRPAHETEPRSRARDSKYGFQGDMGRQGQRYGDEEGREEIPAWFCEDECPVEALDDQSGYSHSNPGPRRNRATKSVAKGHDTDHLGMSPPPDAGGASRYFKQIGGRR